MEKKYDHSYYEKTLQERWLIHNTYSQENNPGELYSIDTPPPTVSGALHIGHVFSYTHTDIIARYKRMSGYSVFYPMGFDDNGLATERFVEKKNNVTSYGLGRSAFIELCLQETHEAEEHFKKLWQALGLSVDWSLLYSTIDKNSRLISQESFIELYKKGHVYRKNEPALYCPVCRTSVAQAELEDKELASFFTDVAFIESESGKELVIGTTRPELLASCGALLYNPNDERYQWLKGKAARVALYNYEIPIYEDDLVEPAKGTGLVMCSTFGDKTDIEWFKKFNIPYRQAIGADGRFTEITGFLQGLKAHEARALILEKLKEAGLIRQQREIKHMVNVHERCKKEIEYLMLAQWFLRILPYKQEMIDRAHEVIWYPAFMKTRYINWVENISWDWCLSRQRYYGIPFPVWHCATCKEIIFADKAQLPIDPQETHYNKTCPNCNSANIVPDTDVMDTWNTSSLSPYICAALQQKNTENIFNTDFVPMSMRPQAHDIIRTWAFYTIVKTVLHQNRIPWKYIVISGHVVTGAKEKISKSQSNSPLVPENLLKLYPADAIRYWTASGSLGYDTAFSETQLGIGQKLIIKLWNAFKFSEQYIENYVPQTIELYNNPLNLVNRWLMHQAQETFRLYESYFKEHEISLALGVVEKFFWHDYCDTYIELVKDQLMNPGNFPLELIEQTRTTLYSIGLQILQLYAPFVPHVTEAVYSELYKKHEKADSLHQTKFSQVLLLHSNWTETDAKVMQAVLDATTKVRKLKTEAQLSLKTELNSLAIYNIADDIITELQLQGHIIKGIAKTQTITYSSVHGESFLKQENDGVFAAITLD